MNRRSAVPPAALKWSLLAFVGVVALSALVGWVGEDHGFGWELAAVVGTALGTTLLAVSTGYLALTGRDQVGTARAALNAQTAPFLASVPAEFPVAKRDPTAVHAVILRKPDRAEIRVPVRNVGNGLAVVQHDVFTFSGGTPFVGLLENPALPSGEQTVAAFYPGRASSALEEVTTTLLGSAQFSVAIQYGDAEGTVRGAIRLDVAFPRDQARWLVQQVHWGDSWEAVRDTPTLSTQPLVWP